VSDITHIIPAAHKGLIDPTHVKTFGEHLSYLLDKMPKAFHDQHPPLRVYHVATGFEPQKIISPVRNSKLYPNEDFVNVYHGDHLQPTASQLSRPNSESTKREMHDKAARLYANTVMKHKTGASKGADAVFELAQQMGKNPQYTLDGHLSGLSLEASNPKASPREKQMASDRFAKLMMLHDLHSSEMNSDQRNFLHRNVRGVTDPVIDTMSEPFIHPKQGSWGSVDESQSKPVPMYEE
jgi:hypothetical protein